MSPNDRDAGGNALQIGVCVPNFRTGAGPEAMIVATETAERLGWHSVWTTDHVLADSSKRAQPYAHIYEALTTLAWLGGRFERVRMGVSVLVVPMRNAVVLAKELASLDALLGGRLIAGVGIGWNEIEFGNLGLDDRFRHRGAYLEETIALWRHLWSGASEPFEGRFHAFDDFHFSPLPAQGADVPIWIGATATAALQRTGRVADGYHATGTDPATMRERAPIIADAAAAAGRPDAGAVSACRGAVRLGPAAVMDAGRFGRADPGTGAGLSRRWRLAPGRRLRRARPDQLQALMERFDRAIVD